MSPSNPWVFKAIKVVGNLVHYRYVFTAWLLTSVPDLCLHFSDFPQRSGVAGHLPEGFIPRTLAGSLALPFVLKTGSFWRSRGFILQHLVYLQHLTNRAVLLSHLFSPFHHKLPGPSFNKKQQKEQKGIKTNSESHQQIFFSEQHFLRHYPL